MMSSSPRTGVVMRVPEITVVFWSIKILTTGMGETLSDFLGTHLDPAIAGAGILAAFAGAFVVQLRAHRYVAWKYWFAVSMVSVLGTVVADVVHTILGVPYVVSSAVFAVGVAVILLMWHRVTGSLDVHDITDAQSERFYWATVCATFALGTAVGDWTATSLHLGYLLSTAVFAVAIAIPFVAWRCGLDAVVAFWTAYVLTRPLGASAADWLADRHHGGLGLGTGPVTVAWLVAIAVLVAIVSRSARPVSPTSSESPVSYRRSQRNVS